MSKLKEMAAKSSITNMLKGNHFSICCVDDVANMFGQKAGGDAYSILKTLHCVNFQDMQNQIKLNHAIN